MSMDQQPLLTFSEADQAPKPPKFCPGCGGNIVPYDFPGGVTEYLCVQCGHDHTPPEPRKTRPQRNPFAKEAKELRQRRIRRAQPTLFTPPRKRAPKAPRTTPP